jgi:two-component system, chemotaxis family, chemotaxis protein CheY
VLRRHFDTDVTSADTAEEALALLRQEAFDLVLVNRVLDANGASGLEFIRLRKNEGALKQPPMMLVSNFEEAQREALQAGALPGFGKSALGQPAMLGRVRSILE